MILELILVGVLAIGFGLRFLGVRALAPAWAPARLAIAGMFLFTGFAHFWPEMRSDFEKMVPPALGSPRFWVTLTGLCEILGAVGLWVRKTRVMAGAALVVLLVAMFPANVRAAREGITLRGEAAPPLWVRLPEQLLFIGWTLTVTLAKKASSER